MSQAARGIYDFYVTPQEYEQAQANGIEPKTLNNRIREHGWSKAIAMIKPKRKKVKRSEQAAIAVKNGIPYSTYINRINNGMDEHQAATLPLGQAGKPKVRTYPAELVERAARNGVSYGTLKLRVTKLGWSKEEAATIPIFSQQEISRMGGAKAKAERGTMNA